MRNLAVVLIFCVMRGHSMEKTLPSFVKTCKTGDPNLSKCFAESVETLRPFLIKDQPKLNLPSIDPLHLSEVTLVTDNVSSDLRLDSFLKNVEITGGRHFELQDTQVTLNPYRVHLRIHFPQLLLRGDYKANGKILLFEFDGHGKIYANISNLDFAGSWVGKEYEKGGVKFMNMQLQDIDVKFGKIHMHLDNLFKDRPDLTEAMNQSINENADILEKDFYPELKANIGSLFTAFMNRFHETFPLEILYPKN